MAAAGASVNIYCETVDPEMRALLDRGAASGRLTLHLRPWAVDIFANAALCLADAETEDEARAFYCAALSAGVPVNVIDKPAYCQFQFGAIVNRTPVVVGISTDGAAPILGQAIRRRIETLLPPGLAQWARFAKDIRARVMPQLAAGGARRVFWEKFSDLAFRSAPDARAFDEAMRIVEPGAQTRKSMQGRVTLVGSGPGDSELLTLKAVRALQAADVILFDDLVADEVLELARREAKRMMVGKRGQRESCSQHDINELMVRLAKQGRHVVRLKSGDPMIFGRAGEEIDRLERASIPVDVVPGITAGAAMASALRTSLTHRDLAHSVRYVTGHSRAGKLSDDLDWQGLADAETTLVFYMGGKTSRAIAKRLIQEGLTPETPVAIAESISRPDMRVRRTELSHLAEYGIGDRSTGPILVAIGAVFKTARGVSEVLRPKTITLNL